jgi:PilZ domain
VIAMLTAVKECRLTPRETLSEPVRVRPCDPLYPEEICTTANVSRSGLYFVTPTKHYVVGMNVVVTLNFGQDDPIHREQIGDVVRVDELDEDKRGVAIRILMHNNPGIYSGT